MKSLRSFSGFSLLEVMFTIAFLGIVLVPIAMMYNTNYLAGADSANMLMASNLAQNLLDEIRSKSFEETPSSFGNDSGEVSGYDRTSFDDVDDYDIYTTAWGAQSPPRDISGTQMTDYSNFSRTVSVINIINVNATIPRVDFSNQGDGTTDFKMVTVTVTWDNTHQSTSLQYIAANY